MVCAALLTLAIGAGQAPAQDTTAAATDGYRSRRAALDRAHRDRLTALAARCRELGLAAQSEATLGWFPPRDPRRQYLFLPPPSDPAQPADDAPTIVRQWYAKFREHRAQYAAALFDLARQELAADRPTRAYQLLHEVLHEDPDHPQARQALGYRKVNGQWRVPSGVIKSRPGRGADPLLGFRAGQYWVIDSGHFHIATDHSEQAGRRLAERLEELYAVWQQLFFRYWSNRAALARRLEGKSVLARSLKRHDVVLFRSRQQYLDRLRPVEPLIELSSGTYLEARRAAYFYVGEEANEHIWLHEVTHQLFSETGRVPAGTGMKANFWIVEGAALYMESLRSSDHCATVGGIDADRLQYARYRALNEGFYVPLEELVVLGRQAMQQREDVRRLYSEAAGLAHFLMDYRRGAYRPAMVDYLQAVYAGRDRADTLRSAAGVPLAELDKQYHGFLDVTDDDLAFLPAAPVVRSLSLGRTAVTDAGLAHLAGQTQLQWLDVAYTRIGDRGLAHLQGANALNHLIAEHTQITDAALQTIGGFHNLEILDLTGTRITDAGLAHLAGLTKLKELWLGDTQISDAGLRHLEGLKHLQTLDVERTHVSADGWNRLKKMLPSLNDRL